MRRASSASQGGSTIDRTNLSVDVTVAGLRGRCHGDLLPGRDHPGTLGCEPNFTSRIRGAPVSMTIGELARQAGLSVSAIRYYQRRGLLPVAAKSSRGWQRFGSDDVARLKIVELAKSCGFSLNEVAVLIDALYGPASPTATWQAMGEAK